MFGYEKVDEREKNNKLFDARGTRQCDVLSCAARCVHMSHEPPDEMVTIEHLRLRILFSLLCFASLQLNERGPDSR